VQGTVRTGPISLKLGFAADDFGYAIDLGQPVPSSSMFARDPEIKVEALWAGPVLRPSGVIAERGGPAVKLRDEDGRWHHVLDALRPYDSMLAELADPRLAPELMRMRERIRSWRFYDHVRTDAAAPARAAHLATRTPILSHDGHDLAAALQTIREIGDAKALDRAVDRAFEGSRVEITEVGGRLEVALRQPGMLRPLHVAELSDGTLRYLLWVAALLTPRPPELLVLNEPETSLHPDRLEALGELIVDASAHAQIITVTHAPGLVDALNGHTIELVKELGQTMVVGQGRLDGPSWHWPSR
jgi:predicted ATPase